MPRVTQELREEQHQDYNSLFFNVVHGNSEVFMPGFKFSNQTKNIAIREDNQKVLALYGDTYELQENKDFMLPIIQEIGDRFGYENLTFKASSIDDRRFFLDVSLDTQLYEVTKDDTVCPMVSFVNSYDGSLKRSVSLSYFRQICTNGMKGFSTAYSLTTKHIKGSRTAINTKKLMLDLDKSKEKLDRFKSLHERRLLPTELEEIVKHIADNSKQLAFPKKELINLNSIIEKETRQLGSDLTKWITYNAFNNILNHSSNKITPADLPRIDEKILKLVESY